MTTERLVLAIAGAWVGVVLASAVTAPVMATSVSSASAGEPAPRALALARHLTRAIDPAERVVVPTAIFDMSDGSDTLEPPMIDEVIESETPAAASTSRDVPVATEPTPVDAANSMRAAELTTLALINASRAAGGLAALSLDEAVSVTARAHSGVEAERGYVYHDGPDGSAYARDASACGNALYGENTGKVWDGNVATLHREFMAEPWAPINHRTNIMNASFTRIGIGAIVGRDAMYLTTVFCR